MAAAALVAVVIGGVVGCSAENGDPARTGVTDDEPAAPDTPTAAATKEPGSGSPDEVPGGEPAPTDANTPDRTAGDGALEGAEAQAPEIDGSEDEVATSATTATEHLASLVGMTAAELEAASSDDPEWPEQWVGWSADGTAWGWQSLTDAFGIKDGDIWAEFAVGRGFVIARVATFQLLDPADSTGETSVSQDGQFLPTR